MSESDWRNACYMGLALLGIILFVVGLIPYFFPQNIYQNGYYVGSLYPYRKVSVSLFIAGATLLVVAFELSWRADREKQKITQATNPTEKCGRQMA